MAAKNITEESEMRLLLGRLMCVATVTLCSPSAFALVGGSVDANLASSPWAGVGAVSINGSVFSGALIDSQHVLTAAHVVSGQQGTPGNVSFSLNVGGNLTQTLSATAINVFPGYTGTAPGSDGVWHDDLAIITLAAPVSGGVPTYSLFDGSLAGATVTLVAYGSSETNGASASVKRVGQNRVDVLLVDDDGGSSNEIFAFDFDGPDSTSNFFGSNSQPANLTLGAGIEAQYAGGDSGSPVFVNDNGVWKIAGIGTFNGDTNLSSSNTSYGAIGGGTIVSVYATWIGETLATPVPEPKTWLMLLAGLGLVGIMARRVT